MEDDAIIDLYWARNETAIEETKRKYAGYCHSVAYGILRSEEDAQDNRGSRKNQTHRVREQGVIIKLTVSKRIHSFRYGFFICNIPSFFYN